MGCLRLAITTPLETNDNGDWETVSGGDSVNDPYPNR
jgi:hypothetical protein